MYKLRMRIVCVLATICMLVGSLQLPGNVRIVHASTTSDNVLLDYDFENKTTEDFMTDWSINSGYHNASAAIEIETINDNNVLVLNQSKIESTDTKGNLNIRKRFAEGYDKVVLSYSVATKDGSGVLYGPSLISHSTSTTRAVEVYINGKIFKDRYNSEGDIQVKSGCAAMTWHTVKVVYEKVSEENSYKYSVYINDEEVVKDATPTNQGKVYGVYMELYRKTVGTIYVDNIKLTTEDHIPVTPTVLETIDFAEAPYTVETGKKINVSTTFAPASVADNYTVSYKMEDENVATVDTAGVVTGVTQGSTTITATATHNTNNNIKISATATVTVTAQEVDENELNFSVNGTGYATLQAAIAAANGSTAEIDLLANVTSSEDITIDSGVTLDLNGYTLDMGNNYLYSLGDVVDNSTGKTGRLVVGTYAEGEKDDVPEGTPKGTLAEANSQMPVYIADEGYMFATMLGQGNVTEATADDFTVDFRPSFGSAYSILAAGADAAKLEFIVRLDWTDEGKNYYQLFKCSDDLVKTIYGQNKIFRVTFNGLTGYKEGMKVTVHVKSDLGVDWLNNSYQMTKTSNE